jgi:DeoR/GlpR family transcriptional regulator of sugar metabolism
MIRTGNNHLADVVPLVASAADFTEQVAAQAHSGKGGTAMHAVGESGESPKEIDPRARRKLVLAVLEEQDYVSVAELADRFEITPMSVRRDLAMLEERGLLSRVRGGAVSRRAPRATGFFANALRRHGEEKRRIAAAAAALLEPSVVTFFYSGTTVACVVEALHRPLRATLSVATNSLAVIDEVSRWDNPHLVVVGGVYLPEYMAFVGPQTERSLQELNADIAVVGCDGLSAEGGLTTPHQLVAQVGTTMMARARRVIAVADSSKVGRHGFMPIAPADAVDVLITDAAAEPEEVAALRDLGVEVVLA